MIAVLEGDDLILCQITSQARSDAYAISLDAADFVTGGLNQSSWIRPNRLFTADSGIVLYRAGRISETKFRETIDRLVSIVTDTL